MEMHGDVLLLLKHMDDLLEISKDTIVVFVVKKSLESAKIGKKVPGRSGNPNHRYFFLA